MSEENIDLKKFEPLFKKYAENTINELKNVLSWTNNLKNSISYKIENDNSNINFIMNYYAPYLDYWLINQPNPKHPRKIDPRGLGKPPFLQIPVEEFDKIISEVAKYAAEYSIDYIEKRLNKN